MEKKKNYTWQILSGGYLPCSYDVKRKGSRHAVLVIEHAHMQRRPDRLLRVVDGLQTWEKCGGRMEVEAEYDGPDRFRSYAKPGSGCDVGANSGCEYPSLNHRFESRWV
jgi:hypothetical protein